MGTEQEASLSHRISIQEAEETGSGPGYETSKAVASDALPPDKPYFLNVL